jgi:hypothetical protein
LGNPNLLISSPKVELIENAEKFVDMICMSNGVPEFEKFQAPRGEQVGYNENSTAPWNSFTALIRIRGYSQVA